MILELSIENFAIIERLNLPLYPGLSVFTGETGAGKSIIVDALEILTGGRASSEYIRAGAERAVIQGLFQVSGIPGLDSLLKDWEIEPEDGTLILCREINRAGRHICRINGRIFPLSLYQGLGKRLVDIHGQHGHQDLLSSAFQMDLVDSFLGLTELRKRTKKLYCDWKKIEENLLRQREGRDPEERQFLEHQLRELESARLMPGEEEELEQKQRLLKNAASLREGMDKVYSLLYGGEQSAYDGLAQAEDILTSLEEMDPSLASFREEIFPLRERVEKLARVLRDYRNGINLDSHLLKQVEERLDLLHTLKRKYRTDLEGLIRRKEEITSLLAAWNKLEEEQSLWQREKERIKGEYLKAASLLSQSRRKGAEGLAREVIRRLQELAMPQARLSIQVEEVEAGPEGLDKIVFMFQPNRGEGFHPRGPGGFRRGTGPGDASLEKRPGRGLPPAHLCLRRDRRGGERPGSLQDGGGSEGYGPGAPGAVHHPFSCDCGHGGSPLWITIIV